MWKRNVVKHGHHKNRKKKRKALIINNAERSQIQLKISVHNKSDVSI